MQSPGQINIVKIAQSLLSMAGLSVFSDDEIKLNIISHKGFKAFACKLL